MSKWSKLPPRKPCYALFRGARMIRQAMFERVCEPVEVRDVHIARIKGLAVAMTGRATLFPLENFEGEWMIIDMEAA